MKITVNSINYFHGMLQIPVPFTDVEQLQELQEQANKGKQITIELKAKSKHRSLNANNYCWSLCQEIAEELSKDGAIHTKEDVYREAIKTYSAPAVYATVDDDKVNDMIGFWESHGVGWVAEVSTSRGSEVDVMLFAGSSQYDTKQMSRLIDGLLQDASALGLQVISPADRDLLLNKWGKKEQCLKLQ